MKRLTTFVFAAILTALPATAFAAAGEGLPWMDFMFRVINFVLVIGIIWKFAGAKIREFFVGRQYQIKSELEDLAVRRKEAEVKLKEVEASIANIETERAEILEQYRAQGEALKASIVADAEKKAEAVKVQAKMAVEQESKQAIEQLKAEMAEMVVAAAEDLLKGKLDAKAQQKLIDDSITKVVLN